MTDIAKNYFVKRKNFATKPQQHYTNLTETANYDPMTHDYRYTLSQTTDKQSKIFFALISDGTVWTKEKVQPHKNCILLILGTHTMSIFHIFAKMYSTIPTTKFGEQ